MNGSPVGCMSWIDQSHLQISQCRGGKPPAKLADSQARCQDDAGAFVLHHAGGNVSLASGRLRRWEERKDRGLSVPYSSKSEQIQTSNHQSVPSIIGSSRRSLDFGRGSARTGTSCLLKRGIRTIQRSACCCLLARASCQARKKHDARQVRFAPVTRTSNRWTSCWTPVFLDVLSQPRYRGRSTRRSRWAMGSR